MTTPNRFTTALLALSVLTACGLPAAAQQANAQQQDRSPAQISSAQKMDLAAQSLDLTQSDLGVMSEALANPMMFVERKNDQEFSGELLVHAKTPNARAAKSRIIPSMKQASAFVDEYVVRVPEGLTEGEFASILMATGDYLFVEPNWKLFPLLTPNDSQFGSSWQHSRIQSTNAWDLHTGDSDIIVAICDSGVDTNHPDLEDALVPGYNAVDHRAEADGGLVEDVNGHGTFVAGCAAAQGNNGTGVVGVGWDFRVMPIRVSNLSSGNASSFAILEGARWAVDNGAHAINASFSGGNSNGNQTAAKYIIDRGGLFFWASGNDNAYVTYDSPDLVIVGSTTSSDNKSGFSNYGPAVDLTAPGSSVRSTRRGGSYGPGSGTSYASPVAAGVGAMIFSVRSDLSGQDVQDILYRSVDDLGAPGRDDSFGRGRVNTFNAVQTALAYQPRIGLPVNESFDSASWMDLLSTTSGSVSTISDAEAIGEVLVLDSTDQVTSGLLGGRTLPSGRVEISFGLKSIGVEAGESFGIEYLTADGAWESAYSYTSLGTDTNGYLPVGFVLPLEFMWHGVQFRMTANGSDASDQWLIEDLFLGRIEPAPVAPFVDSFESGVVSRLLWDDIDGPTAEIQNGSYAAKLIGEQEMESITVPMIQFGLVPGYVRFDAWADAQAGADDILTVEVIDQNNVWNVLATFDGTMLSTEGETFQYRTPILTWFNDTVQIRVSSEGDDAFYVDNVYLGPDMLQPACSQADIVDFGQLDFVDVSAFVDAFGSGSLLADMNDDQTLDFVDISLFVSAFSKGCP